MRINSNVDKEIYKEINDESRKIAWESVDDSASKTEDNDKKTGGKNYGKTGHIKKIWGIRGQSNITVLI